MTPAVVATQVTLLMVGGLTVSWLLRNRAAALRHLVLFTSLMAAAVVPAATPWFPASLASPRDPLPEARVSVAAAPPTSGSIGLAPEVAQSPAEGGGDWTRYFVWIWMLGTALVLMRLAREGVALSRLRRSSPALDDEQWQRGLAELAPTVLRRRVTLRVAPRDVPIMSFGLLCPQIVVPGSARDWGDTQRRSVLCHEFAHIVRRDSLRFAALELVRALHWWHPLVWMAISEARFQAECACDDIVVGQQVPATEYAEQLVDLARLTALPRSSVAAATAYTSFLERRVLAMLTPSIDRSPTRLVTRYLALAPLFVLSLLVASAFARPSAATGTLVGTVRPDGGQPLAQVDVVLTSVGQPDVRVRTDATGSFSVDLAPGAYRAAMRVPGFKRYEAAVDVVAGERVVRDFALSLGALTERISVVGETDPQAVPIELRPDTPVVSQVGVVSIPRRVDDRKAPTYPASLRDAGVQGTVKVAGRVNPDGFVSDVRILESPHPELAEIVTRYMTTMRYEPTKVQGTAMSTELVLTIDFRAQR